MKYYIDSSGKYLGGTDGDVPEDWIPVTPPPEYSDQVWQFPGWSESRDKFSEIENQWREIEMLGARENVIALQFGDDGIPGTEQHWKDYWLALRKWTDSHPDFPDSSKRPKAPE